jgi:hypothetical protein
MNDILKWLHEGVLLLMMGSEYRPGMWLLSFRPALGRSGVISDHSFMIQLTTKNNLDPVSTYSIASFKFPYMGNLAPDSSVRSCARIVRIAPL